MRTLFVHALIALIALTNVAADAGAAPAKNPRLASLQIEIWPEYDRPQSLVILKGELAADAALPAAVALRIPASAGAPAAVAYADPTGNLLNLNYERENAGSFVVVRLTTPQRAFHVEFYDALVAAQAEREYRYAWPGDLAVDKLTVLVKEPAAASSLSVSPELGTAGRSQDGLQYRAGDFGPLKAGEQWTLAVRYTKSDPRSSSEILAQQKSITGARVAEPSPAPLIAAIVAALVAAAGAFFLWRRRAKARALRAASSAAFCRKCGRAVAGGDRFCAGCGAALT